MPAPTDVKAVQSLIGMVNYLTKFCPHLSDQCKVLRDLTHKDSEWKWTTEHEEAFLILKETIVNAEGETVSMVQHSPISSDRLQDTRSATGKDKTLQLLIKTMSQRFPKDKSQLPSEIGPYFSLQGELSHQDGMVFRGERAVIPDTLRSDITSRWHSSDRGVEGCPRRARECVYWLGMNDQIQKYIAKCDICRSMDNQQQKETLMSHKVWSRPWAKVGIDLSVFDSKDYLITMDYFTNLWEKDYLADTKSTTVIKNLRTNFACQGIPDSVISDNSPQYGCQDFQKFNKQWGFQHVTSSPGHPQSNGKAESAVKTAKRLLIKAKAAGQDTYLALLDLCNTPSQGLESSPDQRLLSHCIKTLLPTKASLLIWRSASPVSHRLGDMNFRDCSSSLQCPSRTYTHRHW